MTIYGPSNPHPLSRMETELVWEGKYDEFGNRREVNVAGLAMPLQKIETIDEPRSRAEEQGSLFDSAKAHRDDFRNRLIWGDTKLVMGRCIRQSASHAPASITPCRAGPRSAASSPRCAKRSPFSTPATS